MREVDRRSKYSRRIFLQGAAAAAPVVAVASSAGLSIEDAWADDATALAPSTLKTLVKVARDIYPHDFLVDSYYITAIKPWDGKAAKDPAVKTLLEDGVRRLDQDAQDRHKRRPTRRCRGRPTGSSCCRASNKPISSRSFAPIWSSRSTTRKSCGRSSATRAPPPSMAATSNAVSTTSTGCRKSEDVGQNISWEDITWQNSI